MFDLNYFRGKRPFEDDRFQNCLVFQPPYRFFNKIIIAIMF